MLLHQVSECTKLIIEAKDKHLDKLSSKLHNPGTAPKTYWSIIKKFFKKKLNFLIIITLSHNILWSKMQVPDQTLNMKLKND